MKKIFLLLILLMLPVKAFASEINFSPIITDKTKAILWTGESYYTNISPVPASYIDSAQYVLFNRNDSYCIYSFYSNGSRYMSSSMSAERYFYNNGRFTYITNYNSAPAANTVSWVADDVINVNTNGIDFNTAINIYTVYLNGGSLGDLTIIEPEPEQPDYDPDQAEYLDQTPLDKAFSISYDIGAGVASFALSYIPGYGKWIASGFDVLTGFDEVEDFEHLLWNGRYYTFMKIAGLDDDPTKKLNWFVKSDSTEFGAKDEKITLPLSTTNNYAIRPVYYNAETRSYAYGPATVFTNIDNSRSDQNVYTNYDTTVIDNVTYNQDLRQITTYTVYDDHTEQNIQYVYVTNYNGDIIDNSTVNNIINNSPVSIPVVDFPYGSGANFFSEILSKINILSLLTSLGAIIMAILTFLPVLGSVLSFLPAWVLALLGFTFFVTILLGCIRVLINFTGGLGNGS